LLSPKQFPVSYYAGTVSSEQPYLDTPGDAAVFVRGDRYLLNQNITHEPLVPQGTKSRAQPFFYTSTGIAGEAIDNAGSTVLAWFPGSGLVNMQVASTVIPDLVSTPIFTQSGAQLLSESGIPIIMAS